MARPVSFSDLFDEINALVSRHGASLTAATAAITALFVGIDWLSFQSDGSGNLMMSNMVIGLVVGIFGQYLIVERLLADRHPTGQGIPGRRYGSLFGAMFISGLGILFGLVFLVLPGFYLAGRWLTIAQQVIENESPSMAALNASWQDSEQSQLVFTVAYLLGLLPTLVTIAFSLFPEALGVSEEYFLSSLVTNLLAAISNVAGWVISTAAYRKAVPADNKFGEVFV